MKRFKKFPAFAGTIIGFVASVFGIVSFLQANLHLGSILIPNPIIIIIAFIVSAIGLYCAFYLGGLYMFYAFTTGLFKLAGLKQKSPSFPVLLFQAWQYSRKRKKMPESSLVQ